MIKDDDELNGDGHMLNGEAVDGVDDVDQPAAVEPSDEFEAKRVTIDGPSIITDKMSVFMVRAGSNWFEMTDDGHDHMRAILNFECSPQESELNHNLFHVS